MKRSLGFLGAMVVYGVIACGVAACSGRSEVGSTGALSAAAVASTPKVEIAFLNHPPVRGALTEVDKLLASYGNKVTVIRYDLETKEGAAFAKTKGLTGHVPLAIFIDGAMEI